MLTEQDRLGGHDRTNFTGHRTSTSLPAGHGMNVRLRVKPTTAQARIKLAQKRAPLLRNQTRTTTAPAELEKLRKQPRAKYGPLPGDGTTRVTKTVRAHGINTAATGFDIIHLFPLSAQGQKSPYIYISLGNVFP